MPHTINGIGTWYYGKRDVHRIKGSCEFCGSLGELSSYDTTLYFVVVFVPVIPLQHYRVLEECPACQKHRVINARKWKELKANTTQEIIEPLEKNPRDREALLQGLGHCISFQDPTLFEKLIPMTEHFREDADVQSQLGAAYSYFSRRAEATEAYKRSLLAEDRPETRQSLATNLLRLGEPDEAEPLIRHVIENKEVHKLFLPFLLIDTYQSQGKHQQALDILDQLEAAFPDLSNDKAFKKLRAQSTKNLESGKPIKRATLVDSSRSGVQQGSNWSRWIPLILLIGLIGGYLGRTIWLGSNCTVYLLNGTTQPYDVKVKDRTIALRPGTPVAIQVEEGDLHVDPVNPRLGIAPLQCKVETPFLTRIFSRPVFVLNPDASAVLVKQTSIYAAAPPMPPADVPLPLQTFHQLDEPDYVFDPFPHSLKVKGNSTITKTRLGVHQWENSSHLLQHLMEQIPDASQLTSRVKQLAQIDPSDPNLLNWLRSQLKPDELIQFVQPRLDETPLLVDWHRAFQDTRMARNEQAPLITEYQQRLAKAGSVDQQNARYLLGRIMDDPQGFSLMREAASGENGSFYSMYAVGNRALVSGNFTEAKSWADKLIRRDSRHHVSKKLMREALLALKQYVELDQYLSVHGQSLDEQMSSLMERYRIAAIQGDQSRTTELKSQIIAMIQREAPDQVKFFDTMLGSVAAAAKGDVAAFLNSAKDEQAAGHFATAILKEDLAAARRSSKPQKGQGDRDQLNASLLYLLAKKLKDNKLADQYWTEILADIKESTRSATTFHEMLSGKIPFTFAAARDAYGTADEKRAVLLVLADRFPQEAKALRELSAKLNFQHDVYSLAITKFLSEGVKK